MSRALLAVSLGPVQDFIAQARRTRDLWYGSFLLSEVSKAVARALARHGRLVFPAADENDTLLISADQPVGARNVANKVIALIEPAEAAERAAREGRQAAVDELRRRATRVREGHADLLAQTDTLSAAWDEQVDALLDVVACWAPIADGEEGYRAARRQVESALTARKALREFSPWQRQRGNVPKSSLDPARETVLREDRDAAQSHCRRLRIGPGEQLDAVGLLKRAGGRPEQFIPIANVAAAAWIRATAMDGALVRLREACAKQNALERLHSRSAPWVEGFPHDVEILRPERWDALVGEKPGLTRQWLEEHVGPALRAWAPSSLPPRYVACLVADGDHMGAAIEGLGEEQAHRNLSRRLADFATRAHAVVHDQHDGSLVYAGGDDVLAFVSVERALACATALRATFDECLACDAPVGARRPTLSVGIAVGHVLEHMGALLAEGRRAEGDAKLDRNALAVRVMKRSGGTLAWRTGWDTAPLQLVAAAQKRFHDKRLSTKKVYAVRELLRRFAHWRALGDTTSNDLRMLARDVWGCLRHGQREESFSKPEDAGLDFDPLGDTPPEDALERLQGWADRHLVARELARLSKGQA